MDRIEDCHRGDRPAVLLDWNGTAVDDLDRAYRATCGVLASRRLATLSVGEFRAGFRLPLAGWFGDLGVPVPVRAAAERQWNGLMAARPARLRPDAELLLAALARRNAFVGVVSAASPTVVVNDLLAAGAADLVSVVLAGVTDKAAALRSFTSQRGTGSVFYVGDSEHDMTSARNGGAVPVGYARGYRPGAALRAAGADHLIDDLCDVLALLDAPVARTVPPGASRPRTSAVPPLSPFAPGHSQETP